MESPDLERAILDLIDERSEGATICPSDVARRVGPANGWRALMDPVREAAWRLVEAGEVVITQGGRAVPRQGLRGPIRIGRPGSAVDPDAGAASP